MMKVFFLDESHIISVTLNPVHLEIVRIKKHIHKIRLMGKINCH